MKANGAMTSRWPWVVFAVILVATAIVVFTVDRWVGDLQEQRQTDQFIEDLCAVTPDC